MILIGLCSTWSWFHISNGDFKFNCTKCEQFGSIKAWRKWNKVSIKVTRNIIITKQFLLYCYSEDAAVLYCTKIHMPCSLNMEVVQAIKKDLFTFKYCKKLILRFLVIILYPGFTLIWNIRGQVTGRVHYL